MDGCWCLFRHPHEGQYLVDVAEKQTVPQNGNAIKDQIIRLTGTGAWDQCPHFLHWVEAIREDAGSALVFIANRHGRGAITIAAI